MKAARGRVRRSPTPPSPRRWTRNTPSTLTSTSRTPRPCTSTTSWTAPSPVILSSSTMTTSSPRRKSARKARRTNGGNEGGRHPAHRCDTGDSHGSGGIRRRGRRVHHGILHQLSLHDLSCGGVAKLIALWGTRGQPRLQGLSHTAGLQELPPGGGDPCGGRGARVVHGVCRGLFHA